MKKNNNINYILLLIIIIVTILVTIGNAAYLRKGIDIAVEKKIVQEQEKLNKVEDLIQKIRKDQVNSGEEPNKQVPKAVQSKPSPTPQQHEQQRQQELAQKRQQQAGKAALNPPAQAKPISKPLQSQYKVIDMGRFESHVVPHKRRPTTNNNNNKQQSDGVPYIAGGEFQSGNADTFLDPILAQPNYDRMSDPLLSGTRTQREGV